VEKERCVVMTSNKQQLILLMVDNDSDDQHQVQEACLEISLESELRFASVGEERPGRVKND
jgi:hypothetical protein